MDLKKADKQFAKLTKFYESIRTDGEINKIEADLLKSYVSKFYETIIDLDKAGTNGSSTSSSKKTLSTSNGSSKKASQPENFSFDPVKEVPKVVEKPVFAEVPVSTPTPAPTPVPKPAPAPAAVSSSKPIPVPVQEGVSLGAHKALFDFERGSELSDKLSSTRITDISSSMGINDRVSIMVELFGGNKDAFEKTMKSLNGLSSYEEAKTFLSENVVEKYNWNEGDRPSKVKSLMKLVYRRYI